MKKHGLYILVKKLKGKIKASYWHEINNYKDIKEKKITQSQDKKEEVHQNQEDIQQLNYSEEHFVHIVQTK